MLEFYQMVIKAVTSVMVTSLKVFADADAAVF